ncbi:MAG: 1-acyl-sn-glycerol-3-phosphate acyltransferase [Proteobacteria bacterium]|nr:1-acyl-sn-glycerol-3-phosphate acyltransferase [Pseudomonadota bacterium]HQR04974.1 lysophospholipid acyltransferase family protein [Rhodocyclaceae bacterium]
MSILRSILFMALMVLLTPPCALLLIVCFWLPAPARQSLVMPWVHASTWLIENVLCIRTRVIGAENIPSVPVVVLSKHQSAWETIVLQHLFHRLIFVWKQELKYVPFFGWALAVTPSISIDRSAGQDALRQLHERGQQRLAEGYSIAIFPEGTRVAPGGKRRYKIGGASLAATAGVPVVPVALNSGEVWGRNAFFKRPGVVTISIGPAIDTRGLAAEAVNTRAERWIEGEMGRISPHLYPAQGNTTRATAGDRS